MIGSECPKKTSPKKKRSSKNVQKDQTSQTSPGPGAAAGDCFDDPPETSAHEGRRRGLRVGISMGYLWDIYGESMGYLW